MSFMDAFSGYNQILMHPEDQEITSFMTSRGIYCYKVMPFGLKNARSIYERLVNMMFADQIGRTMKVYVDDMLVKSLEAEDHISHLQQAFSTLRRVCIDFTDLNKSCPKDPFPLPHIEKLVDATAGIS